jgi:hypothetical protein
MTTSHVLGLHAKEQRLHLAGWGTKRADLDAISAMRKSLPAWAPIGTPGHFLKHADEQTVLAVAAVDQAISSAGLVADDYRDWAIIAAPRYIGRLAGTATLARFTRGGGPAISPHVIPQHSLHSISGALSILLASRQPNVGVGGTNNSLGEGLLAALTFPATQCAGVWLVATAWEPEPRMDEQGQCINAPVCHASALGLTLGASHQSCGRLRLVSGNARVETDSETSWSLNAAGLSKALAALTPGGSTACFAWRLPWGPTLVLEAREMVARLAAVA